MAPHPPSTVDDTLPGITGGIFSKITGEFARMPWLVILCFMFIVAMCFMAIFAEVLAPQHYADQALADRLKPPSFLGGPERYLLGTDELGRDVLSRLLYATQISIFVAFAGTLIGAVIGTF
ncbi:MAG: ABC transporter permease, partial [Alphaproteobacteria bacterium]|nr:ABC transporter permease [Alphaproteobacteria bacterium]